MSKRKKIIIASAVVFAGYVIFQIALYFSYAYKTEIALDFSVDDSVKVNGVFIRNEQVIDTPYNDNVHYLLDDGSKVSNRYEVAERFVNASDAELQMKINLLEAERNVLRQSQDKGALASYDVDLVSNQIDDFFGDIYDMSSKGDMSGLSEKKDHLLIYLNRRRISLGIDSNYDERISQISAEISSLQAQIQNAPTKIYSPSSGYFVSGTDGLETLLTYNSLSEKSYSELLNIVKGVGVQEEKNKYVGKIITDYTWYFAFSLPAESADRLEIGKTVNLRFSFNGDEKTEMTVKKMVYDEAEQNAIIFLSCDLMSEYISSARYYEASVIFKSYSGLKIAKSAERILDGERGVYIKLGNQIKFKKLNVIYENKDYLVTSTSSDNSFVRLYDEVVVEGKDLYNGKHIN